jgi:hypothetical protein
MIGSHRRLHAQDRATLASYRKLAKRTLTNLYNENPAWLQAAHRKLDEAVFAAYGWEAGMSDEAILADLLELNQHRDRATTS